MMTAEMTASPPEAAQRWSGARPRSGRAERMARALVSQHALFRGRAETFEFKQREDVLTVQGCLPSFYLKQVLQTMLRELNGIRRIDNQVDVVCSYGLSSVRGE